MSLQPQKATLYHSRTKLPGRQSSKSALDEPWQSQPNLRSDKIRINSSTEIFFKSNDTADGRDHSLKAEQGGDYSGYFVDNADKTNLTDMQKQLPKPKTREHAGQLVESSYQLEKPKKELRSKPPKSESSETLIHLKGPEGLRFSETSIKMDQNPTKEDHSQENGVILHVSKPEIMDTTEHPELEAKRPGVQWEQMTPNAVIKARSHSHSHHQTSAHLNSNVSGANRPSKGYAPGILRSMSQSNNLISAELQPGETATAIHVQPKGEFLDDVGHFITYFEKSKSQAQESVKKPAEEAYLAPSSPKNQKLLLQQELNVHLCENKKLQAQLDYYAEKINEMHATNKLLIDELIESRNIIEQLQNKNEELEGKNATLSQNFKKLKKKLEYTQETLAKEKCDNENNLIALKCALSNNAKAPQEQYQTSMQRRYQTEVGDSKESLIEDAGKIRRLFGSESTQNIYGPRQSSMGSGVVSGFKDSKEKFMMQEPPKRHKKIISVLNNEYDDNFAGPMPNSTGFETNSSHFSNRGSKVAVALSPKSNQAVSVAAQNEKIMRVNKPDDLIEYGSAHKRVMSSHTSQIPLTSSNSTGKTVYKVARQNSNHDLRTNPTKTRPRPDYLTGNFRHMDLFEDSSTLYDIENDSF